MRIKCIKCKRRFVPVETSFDTKYAIKRGDTYVKTERATKWSTRNYCAFCGKWLK